jgi:hypothetical protein
MSKAILIGAFSIAAFMLIVWFGRHTMIGRNSTGSISVGVDIFLGEAIGEHKLRSTSIRATTECCKVFTIICVATTNVLFSIPNFNSIIFFCLLLPPGQLCSLLLP